MTEVAVVYHSGYGHTAEQAKAVAQGANSVAGVTAQLISVDKIDGHWNDLDQADAVVFGAPTYMGSVNDLNRLGGFLGAMAQSNVDQGPEAGPIASDLKTAMHLGERVAAVARQLTRTAESSKSAAELEPA